MNLFNRTMTVSVNTLDEDRAVAQGVFIDSHHELVLSMTVNMNNFKVLEAEGELRRAPHQDCISTDERVKNLIGIDLTHNVRRQILRAVGEEAGCTHFTELALECVKGIKQAKFHLMGLELPPEVVHSQLQDLLKGTCFHFRKREDLKQEQVAR